MKSIIALVLFTSAAIVAGGCGGSQDSVRTPSLYEGAWTGTWTGPDTDDGGTFSLKVDAYGNVSGTMNRGASISGAIGGKVNGTGKFNLTTTFITSGNFVETGQMAIVSTGLNGTFTYWWNGTLYNGTFATSAGT